MSDFLTARNLPWVAADRSVNLLIALLVISQFARYLGPVEFAEFSLAFTIVALLSAVVMFGLQEVVTKDIRNNPGNYERIIITALVMQFLVACLLCGLYYLFSAFITLDSGYSDYLSLLIVTLFFKFGETISVSFDASLKTKFVARARSVIFFVFAIMKLLSIYYKIPIFYVVALFVIEQLVFLLVLLYLLSRNMRFNTHNFDLVVAQSYVNRGLPILLSGIVGVLYLKIDIFLAYKLVEDLNTVGSLAVVTRLIEAALMVPVILCSALGPRIYQEAEGSSSSFLTKLDLLVKLVTTYTMVCFLILFLFAEIVIGLLFGEQFHDSADLLRLHSLVLIFIGFNLSGAKFYIGKGYLLAGLTRNLIAMALVVIVGVLSAPVFGIYGIALGTLFGVVYAGLLHDLLYQNANDLFSLKVKSFNLFANLREILRWKKRKWEF
ncbi:oligosaccharide flippase family protein [Pseudomonadales bacterium]|nr:oligosaccharide flippase family protein [Pseudomonadales bacterium]